ncbi:MAG: hypothetical protein NC320_10635 [Clostridium sp.]|nr:hypothetical protein [Clostridium sp.]MCM1547376.1 hypothetical protein [Ruminococcus sp.]
MLRKILIGAAAALMFCALRPVNAEAKDIIEVDDSNKVILTSDHAASEEINTIQLSLNVETDADAEVTFEFDSENTAKVSDYRYNKESDCINIYLSDTSSLFDGKDSLDIGTVSAVNKKGKNVDVKINAAESSLKYVYNNTLFSVNELSEDTPLTTTAPVTTPSTNSTTTLKSDPDVTTAAATEKPSADTTVATGKPSADTTVATGKPSADTTVSTAKNTETGTASSVTAVKHIASDKELCDWAIKDLRSKTGITADNAEIKVISDDEYEITLLDDSGNVLDTYTIDPNTGIGTNSNNEAVNLPQTGNNSKTKILVITVALILIAAGVCIIKISGIIPHKKDEKQC